MNFKELKPMTTLLFLDNFKSGTFIGYDSYHDIAHIFDYKTREIYELETNDGYYDNVGKVEKSHKFTLEEAIYIKEYHNLNIV